MPLAQHPVSKLAVTVLLAMAPIAVLITLAGRGPVLIVLPWAEVVAKTFTIVVALGIAYFCVGRYRLLREPSSVWLGAAFLGYAILATVYLLEFPGLVGEGPLLPIHPNAFGWSFHLQWTVLVALILVAALARWPGGPRLAPATVYGAVVAAGAAISVGLVWFGAWLPKMVEGTVLSSLNSRWTAALVLAYALAAALALNRGRKEGQPVLTYTAFLAAVIALRFSHDVRGGELYDLAWYFNRLIAMSAFSVLMLGLAEDHLALLEEERAASARAHAHAAELQAIFDGMGDAVLVLDADGRVTEANAQAMTLLGVDKTALVAPIDEHMARLGCTSVDPLVPLAAFMSRSSLGEASFRGFLCRAHPPGRDELLMEVNASPVHDGGRKSGAVLVMRDVTELERARGRAAIARVATAVAQAHTSADLVDSVLPAARDALGADALVLFEASGEELAPIGQHGGDPEFERAIMEVELRTDSATLTAHAFARGLQVAENIEELPAQFTYVRSLGERFGYRAALACPLIVRERPLGVLLGLQLKPRLMHSHELDVVRAVAGIVAVGLANVQDLARIKALERQREEILSVVAHDLRTPIGVIGNYAAVLKRTALRRKDDAQAVEAISGNARRLATMVGDLLDASRIEADRLSLSLESFDLVALLRRAAEHLAPLLGEHPLQSELSDGPLTVRADPNRVEQVLINLLTNAAKYSPSGTPIVLGVARGAAEAVVSVRDRGDGIAESEQKALFERFYRTATARAGKQDGLGLGLYISRGLVEAQGGRIWLESVPGDGSTFCFTLPLALAPGGNADADVQWQAGRRRPYEQSGTIPA